MTSKTIEEYRQRLQRILAQKKDNGSYESNVRQELENLAVEMGASTARVLPGGHEVDHGIPISVLVSSINDTLQTAAMIVACQTAARAQWVAIISVFVAVGSMIAAWIAVAK